MIVKKLHTRPDYASPALILLKLSDNRPVLTAKLTKKQYIYYWQARISHCVGRPCHLVCVPMAISSLTFHPIATIQPVDFRVSFLLLNSSWRRGTEAKVSRRKSKALPGDRSRARGSRAESRELG